MIGKIVKGTSFGGCVNYVLKDEKSRLLEAVGVEGTPSEMAEQFELQTLLNDKVKNTVGHISLNFSAEDAARLATDDKLMLKIAHDYMKLMGIENTQFIIARHIDRDHPHCHIVYNRVDNDGRTISDKNDRFRNEKVCKMLTARYRLHFSEGKENIKFHRLREHDKVKHFIYLALRQEVLNATSWSELRRALRRYKIDTEVKLNAGQAKPRVSSSSATGINSAAPKLTVNSALSILLADSKKTPLMQVSTQDATALLSSNARSLARRLFAKSKAKRVASVRACSTSLPPQPPIPKRRCWQSNM